MTEAENETFVRILNASDRLAELVLQMVQLIKEMNNTISMVNQRMNDIENRGAKHDQTDNESGG